MTPMTVFDALPDLALIELFSYLSSVDILWAFTQLNDRLRALLGERGFFLHVNLSSARRHQFNTLLDLLPLNNIESLVIGNDASSLQLVRWPYLPRLMKLTLKGFSSYDDVLIFVLLHAATLIHVTIASNQRFLTSGFALKSEYPISQSSELVQNILFRHLPFLRSLDLGMNTDQCIVRWYGIAAPISLTYLRVPLASAKELCLLMSTRPLSETLRQLHVTLRNAECDSTCTLVLTRRLHRMVHLHTYTLAQTFFSVLTTPWVIVEAMTAPNVMPVLRRINVAIGVTDNDFDHIRRSLLFTDYRRVDVHFAFSVKASSRYIQLNDCLPRGSRFHPRQVVGVTCVIGDVFKRRTRSSFADSDSRHHLWYTLPWAFDEFFQEIHPLSAITVEVFSPSTTPVIGKSRLRTLQESLLSICSLPHVVPLDRISTFHVSYRHKPVEINLPAVRHITLTNSLNSLNNFSLLSNVRSIQIVVDGIPRRFSAFNWSKLRSFSSLPMLRSLRVILYDMKTTILDDTVCQTIAETAMLVTDFRFCVRRLIDISCHAYWVSKFQTLQIFVEQLHHRIRLLSLGQEPCIILEQDGCGLTAWF